MGKKLFSQRVSYDECIPIRRDNHSFEVDEEGKVTIVRENKGFFNRLLQLLKLKPTHTNIHLEGQGNTVYPLIDGKRTIKEIGDLVREKHKEESEPVYERLIQFLNVLESNGFIYYKKVEEKKVEEKSK